MLRGFLVALVFVSCAGCYSVETLFKMGVDAGFAAAKAHLPGADEILDAGKDLANKGVEESVIFAAEKAAQLAIMGLLHTIRRAGLSPSDFDYNGDGTLDMEEMEEAIKAVERKAKEQPNEVPWDVHIASLLGILGLGFTALKTANRYRKDKGRSEIKAMLNGNAPPPPTDGGTT